MTIRLDREFHRRLKAKLARDGLSFQEKVEALLDGYVNGSDTHEEALQRQLEIARAAMKRYSGALRELAKH